MDKEEEANLGLKSRGRRRSHWKVVLVAGVSREKEGRLNHVPSLFFFSLFFHLFNLKIDFLVF